MGGPPTMSRRTALVLALAAVTGACSSGQQSASRTPSSSPSSGSSAPSAGASSPTAGASSPTASAPSTPSLPAVTPWRPGTGELVPGAKLAAVERVERAGNGADRAVQVIYAQYGGLLTTTASVLVVSRSSTRTAQRVTVGGHTFDVRLSLVGGTWRVTAVHPSHPGPPAARPTTAMRHVLANGRIDLPPAARADVASGQVHDSVLEAMLAVARRWRVGVSVVRSGHPYFVFGTDRPSDHPQGRAFDTWQIDGRPVVRPSTPRSLVTAYMEALAAAGSYNVGGPVLLGSPPQYFSDRTHHDHVHAGFTA